MEACDLLSVEHRLDQIDAELARELAPHMRTFARAYARGHALPPAPDVVYRPSTLATARAALVHPVLADRGLALLRLVAPIAIDASPGVVAALVVRPSWDALAALTDARDAAAAALFGRRAIEVLHALHGVPDIDGASGVDSMSGVDGGLGADGMPRALPPVIAAWSEPGGITLDDHAISHAWDAIRSLHGVDGAVRFERTEHARPRTFVVQPRGEVVVVIPSMVVTPAERFAVLHELGHVLAALALPAGIPRVVDEAAAAYIARAIEGGGEDALARDGDPGGYSGWYSALATAARARRSALARALDRVERALPGIVERPAERPPWALWHDPGAQAAYVAAEPLADAIAREVGPAPRAGALAEALATLREQIDRACTLGTQG
jgi:hypothetical protein